MGKRKQKSPQVKISHEFYLDENGFPIIRKSYLVFPDGRKINIEEIGENIPIEKSGKETNHEK